MSKRKPDAVGPVRVTTEPTAAQTAESFDPNAPDLRSPVGMVCPVCTQPPTRIERHPEGERACTNGHVWRMRVNTPVMVSAVDDRERAYWESQINPVLHGRDFLDMLAAAGVISYGDKIRRVVIDASMEGHVVMFVERIGDAKMLRVQQTLQGASIRMVPIPTEAEERDYAGAQRQDA